MTTRYLQQHWSIRLLCGLAVLLSVAMASADECEQGFQEQSPENVR